MFKNMKIEILDKEHFKKICVALEEQCYTLCNEYSFDIDNLNDFNILSIATYSSGCYYLHTSPHDCIFNCELATLQELTA
jgi:hypothetical protein